MYIPRAATSKHNFPLTESPHFLALKMNIIHGKRNYDINKRVSRIFQAAHLFNEVKKLPIVFF